MDVTAEDTSFAGAAACIAGRFPTQSDLAYFARAFADALEPKAVALNGQTLMRLFEGGFTSALRIGHRDINADNYGWHDPALFVFDAFKGIDLIDFWNLRAVRRNVLPVPTQWLPDLSPFCRKAIAANHRPLPGNPHGVMIRETVMFGRAIAGELIETLYNEHLRVDINGANVRQDWYPKLWRRPSTRGAQERRATLTAARKSFNTSSAEGKTELQFDSLHPEWPTIAAAICVGQTSSRSTIGRLEISPQLHFQMIASGRSCPVSALEENTDSPPQKASSFFRHSRVFQHIGSYRLAAMQLPNG